MSYGYGAGRANPYDQRGGATNPPYPTSQPYSGAPAPSYGRQQYNNAPAMGRDEYAGQNVEMAPLTQNGQMPGRQTNPNAILNECREIDRGIVTIEDKLAELKGLQQRSLDDVDSSGRSMTSRELDAKSASIMNMYRNFAGRVKSIKLQPESGSPKNAPQVGKVDRKLKETIHKYQVLDSDFQKKLKEQMARQYRIVRPEASEAEVREAVEDTNQQVFSQALLQSDRRGQSRAALNAVESRHEEIQKIERQMEELAALFQDMENLVVQQDAAVVNIEMKGEEVVENMDKGTEQIGVAINSARNARKWKWWCLGICVLIIIIIVVVILIYKFVIQTPVKTTTPAAAKRFVLPSLSDDIVISGQPWTPSEKLVVPGLEWSGDKLVVPGVECTGESKPTIAGAEWTPPAGGKWVSFSA